MGVVLRHGKFVIARVSMVRISMQEIKGNLYDKDIDPNCDIVIEHAQHRRNSKQHIKRPEKCSK